MRADELIGAGEMERVAVWKRIGRAIKQCSIRSHRGINQPCTNFCPKSRRNAFPPLFIGHFGHSKHGSVSTKNDNSLKEVEGARGFEPRTR